MWRCLSICSDRFGYSAVQIGLLITPWPIGVALTRALGGPLAERYPAGLLGGIGPSAVRGRIGGAGVAAAHPTTSDIVWRMALAGAGFGMFQSPNNRTMIAAAPRERSGGASGMLGTARLLGQTTGAALVALLLARYRDRRHADLTCWWAWASRWWARRSARFACPKRAPKAARLFAFLKRRGPRVSDMAKGARRKAVPKAKYVTVNDRMQKFYRYRLIARMGRDFDAGFNPELTPRQMLALGVFWREIHDGLPQGISCQLVHPRQALT